MKNRIIILILLFSIVIPTYSQETNVFHIDATQTTPLKLSEIADNVTLVPLNKEITQVQGSAFLDRRISFYRYLPRSVAI